MRVIVPALLLLILPATCLSTISSFCNYRNCASVGVSASSMPSVSRCNQATCTRVDVQDECRPNTLSPKTTTPECIIKYKRPEMKYSLTEKWKLISSLPISKDTENKLLGVENIATVEDETICQKIEEKPMIVKRKSTTADSPYSFRSWITPTLLVGGTFLLVLSSVPYTSQILQQLVFPLDGNFWWSLSSTAITATITLSKHIPLDSIKKYTLEKIIPTGWEAVQKVVLTDFWRRVWTVVWKKGKLTWNYFSMSSLSSLPSIICKTCADKAFEVFETAFNQGGKKSVEKFIEKRVQQFIKTSWNQSDNLRWAF